MRFDCGLHCFPRLDASIIFLALDLSTLASVLTSERSTHSIYSLFLPFLVWLQWITAKIYTSIFVICFRFEEKCFSFFQSNDFWYWPSWEKEMVPTKMICWDRNVLIVSLENSITIKTRYVGRHKDSDHCRILLRSFVRYTHMMKTIKSWKYVNRYKLLMITRLLLIFQYLKW